MNAPGDPLRAVPSLTLALSLGFELNRSPSSTAPGTAHALAAELARRGELDIMLAGIADDDTRRAVSMSLAMDRSRARFGAREPRTGEVK